MKNGRRIALAFAAVALTSQPLAAETTSAAMAVTVTVEESCNLDARPLHFAAVPSGHGPTDARSSMLLTCTPDASYVVTLDDGRHGADGTRRMADATGNIFQSYELYSDAARTRRWGSTAASAVGAVAPADGQAELAIFARLTGSGVQPGAYADTITVTVAF